LYGNFGLRYGPFPTQVYQALLLFTHDPIRLALLRSFLCAGLTAFALLWLARLLRFSPWFAAAICIAPQVWQFQRVLWDASFGIPVSALALAGFAAFHHSRRPWHLAIAFGAALLLPLIHPQGLPLSVAILGALGWECRRDWKRYRRAGGVALAIVLIPNAVYLAQSIFALGQRIGGAVRTGYPAGASHAQAALAPLLGGNLLSDHEFTGFVTLLEPWAGFTTCAMWATRVVFLLAWVGVALGARRAFARPTGEVALGEKLGGPHGLHGPKWTSWTESAERIRGAVAKIVIAALVFQALLFGLMRVPAEPQYFFGSFAVQATLVLFALAELRPVWLSRLLGTVYGAAVCFVTLHGMASIHERGYATEPPWIPLASQVEAVRVLNQHPDATAVTTVSLYQQYPQALRALRLLLPASPSNTQGSGGQWLIRYATNGSAPRGAIEVVPIPPGMPLPQDARPIDLSPLPEGWQPPLN
jgi:hypothetical protein